MAQEKQKNETIPRGRDAETGEFIPADEARKRPRTTTVEEVDTVTPDGRKMLGKRHS
jgi:hypothetical protein